jgi:hypothetical protein
MTPCTHSLWYSIPHTVYLQSGNRTPALPSQAQFAENYTLRMRELGQPDLRLIEGWIGYDQTNGLTALCGLMPAIGG